MGVDCGIQATNDGGTIVPSQGIILHPVEGDSDDILGTEEAVDGSGDLHLHDV